jgi:hypothetical protein
MLDLRSLKGRHDRAARALANVETYSREALHTLHQVWRGRRKFRAGSSALRALNLLPHYPVLTVSRLADKLDVTFVAAARR